MNQTDKVDMLKKKVNVHRLFCFDDVMNERSKHNIDTWS